MRDRWLGGRIVGIPIALVVLAVLLYRSNVLGLAHALPALAHLHDWLTPGRLQKIFVAATIVVVFAVASAGFVAVRTMHENIARIGVLLGTGGFLDGVFGRIGAADRTPVEEAQIVTDLATTLRETGEREKDETIRDRLLRVSWVLQGCARDPGQAARALEIMQPLPYADVRGRPMIQLAVTGLLFLGIIGTFSGLVGVFGSPLFQDMLSGKTPNEVKVPLADLLSSFQLSFGASLIAYVTYLGGRYVLDVIDHERVRQITLLDHDLVGRIKAMLALLQVNARIDLPITTKQNIQDATDEISRATLQQTETVDALRALVSNLASASEGLGRSVERIGQSADAIVRSVRDGRTVWQEIQQAWQGSTTELRESVAEMIQSGRGQMTLLETVREDISTTTERMTRQWTEAVAQIVAQMNAEAVRIGQSWDEHRQGLTEATARITGTWAATIEQLVERMSAEAKRIQTGWDNYVLELMPKLAAMHTESMRIVSESQEELRRSIAEFETVKRATQDMAGLVRQGQDQIGLGLTVLNQSNREVLGGMQGSVAGSLGRLEAQIAQSVESVAALADSLSAVRESARSLENILGGTADPAGRPIGALLADMNTLLAATVRGPHMAASGGGRGAR